MNESGYAILRSSCSNGSSGAQDGISSSPGANDIPHRTSNRHAGQKTKRSPSEALANAGLESMPIWCDVTILAETAGGVRSTGSTGTDTPSSTSNQESDDNHSDGESWPSPPSDVFHIEGQVFNPCGMDNLIVFPAGMLAGTQDSSVGSTTSSTGRYLLSLTSCRMASLAGSKDNVMLSAAYIPVDGHAKMTKTTSDGSAATLPVTPKPSTFVFTSDGHSADLANAPDEIAHLDVVFDLGPAYQALDLAAAAAAKAKVGRDGTVIVDGASRLSWNPFSWFAGLAPPKYVSTDDLENMLDDMLTARLHQHSGASAGQGATTTRSSKTFDNQDLAVLQSAMDREIRDLNTMLSVLAIVGVVLAASYIYTARRILQRSSQKAPRSDRLSSEASAPPHTIQMVGKAGTVSPLKEKDCGSDVDTAPSTPETPSPRRRERPAKLVTSGASPERKEAINAILARVKAPTPMKSEGEGTAGNHKSVDEEAAATPMKPSGTQKGVGSATNAILARVKTLTPKKPSVGSNSGNGTTAARSKGAVAIQARPSVKPTSKGEAPAIATESSPPGRIDGGIGGKPNEAAKSMAQEQHAARSTAVRRGIIAATDASVSTPTLTPTRTPQRRSNTVDSANGQSQGDDSGSSRPGSPSFAQMLMENRQMMRSRNMQRHRGQSGARAAGPKQRRKLTPPPKSTTAGGAAIAAPTLGGDIQARNLNEAIENTFLQDYWDE